MNCEGAISDERLLQLGVCERCVEKTETLKNWDQLLKVLKENGRLYFAEEIFAFHRKLKDFSLFFKKAVGQRMWSLQETWARRILLNSNFSIVAPTGVGKTVLGTVSALYFAVNGKKSYIIVPTALLVQQVAGKIDLFSQKLGVKPRLLCYHAGLSDSERKETLEKVAHGEFEILVTTERFLVNNFDIIQDKVFDFIFVDDVDSFLKSPRNIDKIMKILGFSDDVIAAAFQLIELRGEANRLKRMGKSPQPVLESLERLRNQIEEYKRQNKIGLLVVSGATVKAKRTKRIRLFEELLNFQIGFKPEFLRNIKDFYLEAEGETEQQVLSLINRFGGGCLIFVPSVFGKDYAVKLSTFLNANGVRAYTYTKMDEEMLEKFQRGEYEALIGVASFRSPLARGIDLPERIRYVIFTGVPRMEIRLSWDEYNPVKLLTLLKNIREFLEPNVQERASQIINILRRVLPVSKETVDKVKDAMERGVQLEGFDDYVRRIVLETKSFLREAITPKVIEAISKSREVSLKQRDGEFFLVVADPVAYVQASGRASRMFAGGITRGASFILVDDEKAFYSLKKQLGFMLGEFSPIKFSLKAVEKWFRGIDEDRRVIMEIREGKISKRLKDFIKTALLIVESPTKARTISRFFGRPFKRKIENITVFEVSAGEFVLNIVASMGHIYDLVLNEGFHGVKVENNRFTPIYDFIKKCRKCGEQFTGLDFCPKCKSQEYYSKKELVKAMRKIALEVNRVFVATDPDIEGEKIAYDVYCSLHPLNKRIERLEFHEITKKAFLQAIKERREINLKMVEAQLVRRIEDRWIGFELSQKLWHRFRNYRLSAGRVQTPVLGWIIERIKESRKKKRVLSAVLSNGLKVSIENPTLPFPPYNLKEQLKNLKAKIANLTTEERTLYPPPPYTTDTLLRDASAKLGFPATKTMIVAQDLFEMGLCTYHRTDATTVSTVGIGIAKEYIQEKYPSLFVPRRYAVEGAHECIRPTKALDAERLKNLVSLGLLRFPKRLTQDHFQLYDLIFKRFIASQMKEAKLLYQKFRVLVDGNEAYMEHPVSIVSEGFNRMLPVKTANPVEEGEYTITFARLLYMPAARPFMQGEVIALMREKGIGRPSTYAKIVSTLLERNYAIERKNRLISTALGFKVYMYLQQNFGKYTSEETTRRLESLMDLVEHGKADYNEILKELYQEILEIRKA
ncbi:reverse gyrase [Candidatus Bathyarchaeota archaeon]|nr:reverse gyrase [Candidatus Bathyarchaeota archaeon]